MVAVVEQARVPEFVLAFGAFVKVEVIRAVKHVDTGRNDIKKKKKTLRRLCSPVHNILACMGVYHIQQDSHANFMRLVDERLEFLGCSYMIV